jgi:uncharacterized Zn-finger protein
MVQCYSTLWFQDCLLCYPGNTLFSQRPVGLDRHCTNSQFKFKKKFFFLFTMLRYHRVFYFIFYFYFFIFISFTMLRYHMMRHRGEKPHRCPICNKGFRVPSHLKIHMQQHLNARFVCHLCDKVFSQSRYLHRHLKTHSGMVRIVVFYS